MNQILLFIVVWLVGFLVGLSVQHHLFFRRGGPAERMYGAGLFTGKLEAENAALLKDIEAHQQ
jgi:hypothetical protein